MGIQVMLKKVHFVPKTEMGGGFLIELMSHERLHNEKL